MPDSELYVWSFCLDIERDKKESDGWEIISPPFGKCFVYGVDMDKYVMRRKGS